MAKKTRFKDVGPTLSSKELKSLTKAKGKDPLTIMSKALDKGIAIGSKVINQYNTPGGLGTYRYQGTPDNLAPLRGLQIGRGNAYLGSTSYTDGGRGRTRNNNAMPGVTTYNPIVLPKSVLKQVYAPAAAPAPQDTRMSANDRRDRAAYYRSQMVDDPVAAAGFPTDSIEAAINSLALPPAMPETMGMPDTGGYQDISSEYQTLDPLQLAALGQAYAADMIRARRRDNRRGRADYRRDRNRNFGMMISPDQMANTLSFGGGVTT